MEGVGGLKSETISSPDFGAMNAALQSLTLAQPLQALSLRCFFLKRIFGEGFTPNEAIDDGYQSYFSRYAALCQLATNRCRDVERVNHWQIANIVTVLHDRSFTRNQVFEKCLIILRKAIGQEVDESNLFDLGMTLTDVAADLWFMSSIRKFPGDLSDDEPILWELGASQEALLGKTFSSTWHPEDSVKLPQSFTASRLEQIAGIEVVWTSNLADHLLLRDDDTKLVLFHQVSILQLHLMSRASTLPKTLVEETIRTISLLIPPVLGAPNPWFEQQRRKQQRQKYSVDQSAGTCPRLNNSERQIDKFSYRRDRLVLLKRTFDDAEPRNISQLWFDDRKKTQWFTFWVAVLVFIMTVFFGVIQSVAGVVQAWASVKSLKTPDTPVSGPS